MPALMSIGWLNLDPNMSNLLRVAVFGAGHMGRHHARIYSELPDVELVGIVDTDPTRAAELASKCGTHPVASAGELIGKIDAASIAVPTVYHAEVSKPLLEAGIALLIEKPLAPNSTVGRQLVEWAREHNCVLAVGHSERFNPIVQAMNRMKIKPEFIDAQRVSPFRFRSADIGAVMDIMIHDIDVLLHLVGDRVTRVEAVGVSVLAGGGKHFGSGVSEQDRVGSRGERIEGVALVGNEYDPTD
ncbi:MAG: Gfo/Idh/MocA family oxidoreductase [Chloroflexi bacterium]|nr:Gfo/Idh/MocA family oxidoreductase [Chloroflexota bacterium]